MPSSAFTVHIAIHVKSVYTRITLTHFTLAFFLISFVSCVVQGALQIVLHSIDEDSANALSQILDAAQAPANELAWLTRSDGELALTLCTDTPVSEAADYCRMVYRTGQDPADATLTTRFWEAPAGDSPEVEIQSRKQNVRRSNSFSAAPSLNSSGGIEGVTVTYGGDAGSVVLSNQCIDVLLYPRQVLELSKREDWALLGSHFWLLTISCIALVYNSIPQLLAVICARLFETAWSVFSVWYTQDQTNKYYRLISDPGTPCNFDPFPASLKTRIAYEVAQLVLNTTVLFFTCYIGWHLIKAFSAATMRRAAPPAEVIRIYRHFLALFVFLQLSVFFVATSVGLWIDQLINSAVRYVSQHTAIYDALFIFTIATIFPWIAAGWFAVRRETKYLMVLFLLLCFIYVACWSIMFYSQVYRWTFIEWPFFDVMTIASFVVLVGAAAFGVVCWHNFGKGLAHYLHVEDVLGQADFAAAVFTNDVTSPEDDATYDLTPYLSSTPSKVPEDWSVLDIDRRESVFVVNLRDSKTQSSDASSIQKA